MNKEAQIEEMAEIIASPSSGVEPIQMAEALYDAGYRKLPERPKVLTAEQREDVYATTEHIAASMDEYLEAIAQAQLEADVRHYEGKEE